LFSGAAARGIVNRNFLHAQTVRWRRDLVALVRQVHVLFSLIKPPLAPWLAKLVAGCGISYVFGPNQLIPTVIPIVGQLDDLLVLYLATKLVRKLTPGLVLEQCEARAQAAVSLQLSKWAPILGVAERLHAPGLQAP
jgi:uncharacterized membrane protein YkvA (DUF1232 family)